MVAARLLLAPAALPAPVRRQHADSAARRCIPQQELVVTAHEGLAFVAEPFSELLAFWRLEATPAVEVIYNSPLYSRGPSFGGHPGHMGEASHAETVPCDLRCASRPHQKDHRGKFLGHEGLDLEPRQEQQELSPPRGSKSAQTHEWSLRVDITSSFQGTPRRELIWPNKRAGSHQANSSGEAVRLPPQMQGLGSAEQCDVVERREGMRVGPSIRLLPGRENGLHSPGK